jgi:hypothetical protein
MDAAHLRLVIESGAGHEVTDNMRMETRSWFRRFLT